MIQFLLDREKARVFTSISSYLWNFFFEGYRRTEVDEGGCNNIPFWFLSPNRDIDCALVLFSCEIYLRVPSFIFSFPPQNFESVNDFVGHFPVRRQQRTPWSATSRFLRAGLLRGSLRSRLKNWKVSSPPACRQWIELLVISVLPGLIHRIVYIWWSSNWTYLFLLALIIIKVNIGVP